ncbi:MAG TPA: DUF2339 domain-containing protein [Vicinamibacterales bacterium]|nr:DUF2339 domain-containing protein [Vicinamibacterales bacterium]
METLIGLILALLAVPFVLPILSWLSTRKTRRLLAQLEALVSDQRRDIDRLTSELAALQTSREAPPVVERVEPAAPSIPEPVQEVGTYPTPELPSSIVLETPSLATEPVSAREEEVHPPPVFERPSREAIPEPVRDPVGALPLYPPPPPPPPVGPVPSAPAFDWESLVGVKLFSAIAGIALVIAAVFFLRYSIDSGWLQPPVRVAIGILVAVALLVTCELKAARRYPITANALDAAAVAILFATFFAAHALWNLISSPVTFGLLALVTAVAVMLSIRRDSLFIAVLGLLGGFATPVLLSTGENRPVPLFAYLLLLNVGLAWVAYRRRWSVLTWLTLLFTTLYQWGWVLAYLDASTLPLAMGIFVVFPVVSIAALLLTRTPTSAVGPVPVSDVNRTALISAALPVLFAVYLAAIPEYGARPALLFGFVLLIDLGLLAITIARGQELLHATGTVATLLSVALWLAVSYGSDARYVLLGFTATYILFFLFAPEVARGFGRPFENTAKRTPFAGSMLLFVFAVIPAVEPAFGHPWPMFFILLALVLVIACRAIVARMGSLYHVAAFFTVAAQATWSATHLTPQRLGTAVAIYAVFGLVALAVPLTARRLGKQLEPIWGGGAVLLASLLLLVFISSGTVAPAAIWALALLLAVLNAALFVESASGGLPLISQAGSLLSWVVLAIWWGEAAGSVGVIPSLTVLTGLSLVTLAGHGWSVAHERRERTGSAPLAFSNGLYLALAGHLFLTFLALNRQWALPPWPLFGSLVVLTLATSVAALFARVMMLHAAGVIASAVVITAWSSAGGAPPYGLIALAASASVSAYALGSIPLTRSDDERVVGLGAAGALLVGEVSALAAAGGGGTPPFAAVVIVQVVNIGALLWLAARYRWRMLPLVAVAPAWIAVLQCQFSLPRGASWFEPLILAGALFTVFAAFPIALGRRASVAREPYLAAVIASAMFFFAARAAFLAGGLEWMIGVVPVVAGGVLAILLRHLLSIQAVGERDIGRLALVAGAALAFVTVAIPLQLSHQWITLGWAMEGAALAWLYRRIPHRGLLLAAVALLAVVFVRLALNPEILTYEPRGAMRIVNWYLYTYTLGAAAMMLAGWWLSKTEDRLTAWLPRPSHLLPAAGVVLLFFLLNIEIADFYATGPTVTFRFGVTLSQDLTYTIGWLSFGMMLLAAGIYLGNRTARVAAVTLIAVTTFKCFLYDLRSLEGLYRVASFVGLAMSLALVSLALQKFVLSRPRESA